MTLVECFTDSHIDNIAACLRLRPEKLIMVGNIQDMRVPVKRYRDVLQQRMIRTEVVLCDVHRKDLGEICALLEKVLREETEYVIDLTGGDELVIMAVGAVLAGMDSKKRKNIRVEKYDHDLDVLLDCINDNRKLPCKRVSLTVEELIRIHGGILHPEAYQPQGDSERKQVERLWEFASSAPKEWNHAISVMNEFESRSDSRTQVYLFLEHLRSGISKFDEKEEIVRDFLDKLQNMGIIHDQSTRYSLEYTYESPLLRYCTMKAGNILEVKTLLEGRSVLESGAPFFQECRMSVSIDWDGEIHDPMERIPETRNEIDVVMIHDMTPLFISCKNGNIGEEELYKLHTVATRFGGPQARKMLIATDLDQKSPSANRSFSQRAWDMDIYLVKDAGDMTREEWRDAFKAAVRNQLEKEPAMVGSK